MLFLIFSLPSHIFLGICRSINKTNLASKAKGTVAGDELINHCKWTMRRDGLDKRLSDEKNFKKERNSTG
jgi:hypothetical protein